MEIQNLIARPQLVLLLFSLPHLSQAPLLFGTKYCVPCSWKSTFHQEDDGDGGGDGDDDDGDNDDDNDDDDDDGDDGDDDDDDLGCCQWFGKEGPFGGKRSSDQTKLRK